MSNLDESALTAPAVAAGPAVAATCPFLHLEHDPATSASFEHEAHACFKAVPPVRVAGHIQQRYCLAQRHSQCPVYLEEAARPPRPRLRIRLPDARSAALLFVFVVALPAALGAALALIDDDGGAGSGALVGAPTSLPPATETTAEQRPADTVSASGPESEVQPPSAVEELRDWERVAPYDVVEGDSLSVLAAVYETTVEAIIAYNGLPDDVIMVGQRLAIPVGFDRPLREPQTVAAPEASDDGAAASGDAPARGPLASLRAWEDLTTYTVAEGDSLLGLAAAFGTSAEAIAVLNELGGSTIVAGQDLRIPVGFVADLTGAGAPIEEPVTLLRNWPSLLEYRVAQGDALSFIADEFGTTPDAIAFYNGLSSNVVVLGQTLIVPLNFALELPPEARLEEEAPIDADLAGPLAGPDLADLETLLTGAPDSTLEALRSWPDVASYTSQAGDSLFVISLEFDTTVEAIAALNQLDPGAPLAVGVELQVPIGFRLPFES